MKTLNAFFIYPDKELYFREIVSLSDASPNTVQSELKYLETKELIKKIGKKGNMMFYQSNRLNEEFTWRKRLYNLQNIYESEILDLLIGIFSPKAIILFGSYSKGMDISESDIDIFIHLRKIAKFKNIDLKSFEKKLHRKINLIEADNVSENLLESITNGITLYGNFTKYNKG
ncbi:MAG: nucleotidyltransferase family protein [Candidatus Woesearchaeota archaeon]